MSSFVTIKGQTDEELLKNLIYVTLFTGENPPIINIIGSCSHLNCY